VLEQLSAKLKSDPLHSNLENSIAFLRRLKP
jgi:hypothetical protein